MNELPIVLAIDTEQFAGKFDVEMCAFTTGGLDEDELSIDIAEEFEIKFPKEFKEFELIGEIVHHGGVNNPSSEWPTPGWFHYGLGDDFKNGNEEAALEHYKQAHKKYTTPDHISDEHSEWDGKTPLKKRPCHNSVALFFSEEPTASQIQFIKDRAKKFCEAEKLTYTGMRLLLREVITTTKEV